MGSCHENHENPHVGILYFYNVQNSVVAGLSMFQSGKKRAKMVNISVLDHLDPFWAHMDHFGLFQTKMKLFAQNGQSRAWQRCYPCPGSDG